MGTAANSSASTSVVDRRVLQLVVGHREIVRDTEREREKGEGKLPVSLQEPVPHHCRRWLKNKSQVYRWKRFKALNITKKMGRFAPDNLVPSRVQQLKSIWSLAYIIIS